MNFRQEQNHNNHNVRSPVHRECLDKMELRGARVELVVQGNEVHLVESGHQGNQENRVTLVHRGKLEGRVLREPLD
jgi:hypothetical protein